MTIPNSTRTSKTDAPTRRTTRTTRRYATCAKKVEIIAYSLPDWRSFCASQAMGPVATPYDQSNIGMIEMLSGRFAKKYKTTTHQTVKTAIVYNVLRKPKK